VRFVRGARALVAGVVVAGSLAGAGAVSAAPRRPDLTVTAVDWPAAPASGQRVLFSATVTNRGNAPTPAGTISGVGFQVDGVLVTRADQRTEPIAPGQSVTLTAVGGPTGSPTWTAVAGRHVLRAVVDDAGRIAESREGDNVLDARLDVAAGITDRVRSGSVVASLTPLDRTSVTATSVTGDAYAGCFTGAGVLVDGTERFVQHRSVGNDTFAIGAKFADGLAEVPAGATRVATPVSFTQLLYGFQGGLPLTCAAGQAPGFTRFQATSVRTTRWIGSFGSPLSGPIASAATRVDVDFDVHP
jgi:CARDB